MSLQKVQTENENSKRELNQKTLMLRREKWQEDHILWQLCRILKTLIKMVKAAFLPFFDELASFLIPMWGKDKTAQERCAPTVIFASLVRECPEAALKYCDIFLPLFLDASNDENPRVRQNALYGLGLYAEYGSSVFKPVVKEVISRINVVIMHLCAREPENECAYDNAVSALGKICQFHRESINSAQIIPVWLNCLPIKGDLAEAKYVHGELCSMVERSDIELIGPSYQYIPKIISVFAEVLCSEKDLATEETKNRIINILRQLQQTLPSATLESALTYLVPRQEMELKSILSPEEDAGF
ncbi:uncharacterized protein [Nicotiana sylvestris]|uniref:uncharacterized protein n=1 Tax=Nicotiana sylvestris TaxID=4096 RepID=UPI00388CC388